MFQPIVGKELTITLPGELLRASVIKVVGQNAVIAQIITEPLARLSHNYRNGQVIACRRKKGMFGEEWEAVQQTNNSVEELERQEKENASIARKQSENDKQKYFGTEPSRKHPKTSQTDSGNRLGKRPQASKKERRNRGVR